MSSWRVGDWKFTLQGDGNFVREHVPTGEKIGLESIWPLKPPVPVPPPNPTVPARVEGVGCSYYGSPTDPDCDPVELATRFADVGAKHTRTGWMLDAWAIGEMDGSGNYLPGQYDGLHPWLESPFDGFDLDSPNNAYWDRHGDYIEAMHDQGIHVVLTILDLYSWSEGKSNLLWVPNRDLQPMRHNINGVSWGSPNDDDGGFYMLPDETLIAFTERLVDEVPSEGVTIEIGNEFPEKALHYRMADHLRRLGWAGPIQVNRNQSTPSQYDNMHIGTAFDQIAFHGFEELSYLDEHFPDQHLYHSFREAYDSGSMNPERVVISTDGCGFNEPPYYHKAELLEVVADAKARGFAVEHQAREIKLGRFLQGRLDLNDFDAAFARQLVEV